MAYVGIRGCERLARNLMEVHGLETSGPDGWRLAWGNARSQAGSCDHRARVIRLSRPFAELWGPEGMRDTILHEIAHALAGYDAGHGPAWRAACLRIGAVPERCIPADADLPEMRYRGTCPNGHVTQKQRIPARERSCGHCSRRFDRRYLITWTEN